MRHLLCSLYRTGSTAFMQACVAGGMEAILADDPDDPTTPQRRRLMECSPEQFGSWGFPLQYPDGSVLKMLRPNMLKSLAALCQAIAVDPHEGYRVAVLWRHPWEIRKAFENDFNWAFRDKPTPYHQTHASLPWVTADDGRAYQRAFGRLRDHLVNRRDVHSIYEIQYRSNYRADLPSLEHDALEIFETLADQGWPLDPVKAASVIDVQTYCNWRAEDIPEARGMAA